MKTFQRQIARSALVAVALAASAPFAHSFQQPAGAPTIPAGNSALAQQSAGVETPWDVRKIVDNIVKANDRLKPLLSSINPQEWYEKKGAASTYVIQWQTAQRQITDVDIVARQLQQKTDSLSMALDLYFRLEALETSARSVDDGAKKYADRQTADQLTMLIASDFDSRQRLREYVRNLSSDLEQNFKIADAEAQRCRGMISKEAPASTTRKPKAR